MLAKNQGFFYTVFIDEKNNKKRRIKMKKQSGRSMVEMLGTLAIIGVLSVTALTGYKIAMNKNRTNNILYDVNLAMNEIATREYLSLPEITQHVRDLGVRTELDIVYARNGGTESSGFFIQVNGVTEAVCKTLTSNKTAFMNSIQPYSGNAKANACAEGIDVRAEFQYPPVEGGEVEEPASCPSGYEMCGNICCPSGGVCQNDQCCLTFESDWGTEETTCCGGNTILIGNTGDYYHCCDRESEFHFGPAGCLSCEAYGGKKCNGDDIIECQEGKVPYPNDFGGISCCDPNQYTDGYYNCYDCPTNAVCNGTETITCEEGYYWDGTTCYLPCPTGAICDAPNNITGCKTGYVQIGNGCYSCPTGATCDGSETVTCQTGTWDEGLWCCVDDDWNCIE